MNIWFVMMDNKVRTILCPFHFDTNPSMRIYSKYSHCFVCNAHVLTSELDLPEHARIIPKSDPTNVYERIKHIKTLPTKLIRGFNLHTDAHGYYIVWPNETYYKRRNYFSKNRYTAPSGVKPPMFSYNDSSKHLVVIEGELNAMSVQLSSYGSYKIVSPGPASDFMRHIKYYQPYKRITLIVDHDAAGIIFGCQLKDLLLKSSKYVNLVTCPVDYNQILQDSGEEAVREQFEKDML